MFLVGGFFSSLRGRSPSVGSFAPPLFRITPPEDRQLSNCAFCGARAAKCRWRLAPPGFLIPVQESVSALSLRTSDRRHWCGNPFSYTCAPDSHVASLLGMTARGAAPYEKRARWGGLRETWARKRDRRSLSLFLYPTAAWGSPSQRGDGAAVESRV